VEPPHRWRPHGDMGGNQVMLPSAARPA